MTSVDMAPSWVEGADGSGFDVDHLPYGVFVPGDGPARVGVRIGDHALDLAASAQAYDAPANLFAQGSLNAFLAAGPAEWAQVRAWLQEVLVDPGAEELLRPHLHPLAATTMVLPFDVADYVDFYASVDHATNVGRIFRPDGDALPANWKHLPIGYHGRSGTVVVSGTEVRRPSGQRKAPTEEQPSFGPSRRLDVEAELGYVVGVPSSLGSPVGVGEFEDHVFGVVGLNDWSARDIQAWEYVPLGPFLGKSFATSVSAWVTPLAALAEARVALPGQDPEPLEYLRVSGRVGYDIAVEVELNGVVVSRPPYSSMYWAPSQMLAHMTVNGASLRTGDLFGSGTISGPEPEQRGSFLELSWGGKEPFVVDGRERTFLEDGDEVVLRYSAPSPRGRLTLGEVRGRITP